MPDPGNRTPLLIKFDIPDKSVCLCIILTFLGARTCWNIFLERGIYSKQEVELFKYNLKYLATYHLFMEILHIVLNRNLDISADYFQKKSYCYSHLIL